MPDAERRSLMKVTGIVGSPRAAGVTTALVEKALQGARETGAETVLFNIQEAGIGGCMACYTCKDTGVCRQDDGMSQIYDALRSSSAVVIGTPVYMFTVTGQTKTFIDRLFPFLKPDFTSRLGSLPTLMIYTQGAPKPDAFAVAFDSIEKALSMLGLDTRRRMVAAGMSGEDLEGQGSLAEEALAAGRDLVSNSC